MRYPFLFVLFVFSFNVFAREMPLIDIPEPEIRSKDLYATGSYKIGLHHFETSDEGLSSYGSGFSFSVGHKVLPILSAELAFNLWSVDEEENETNTIEHHLLHDFHFHGISLGANAILHLPNVQGPYFKVGRHCWSASVEDVVNLWDGAGCSNLSGLGVYFGPKGSGFLIEYNYIRYDVVSSSFLNLGIRF